MTMTAERTTGTGAAICELSGIEKRYGGIVALAGVDPPVHPGHGQAILGEQGPASRRS
jgi:ABC-type sugar transport system ATPase subunit